MRFNINNAKKCLAKTRKNRPCQAPAMKNGRCKMHGGKSTGARTKEGLARIKNANLKSGLYCKERIKERKMLSDFIKAEKELLLKLKKMF